MATKTIEKSALIQAPANLVWEALFSPDSYKVWGSEFSAGARYATDWKQGSTIVFGGTEPGGLIGTITEIRPNEFVSITYQGMTNDGTTVDTSTDEAKSMIDMVESYTLTTEGAATRLDVSSDMPEEYFDMMAPSWDKALPIIASTAEQMQALAGEGFDDLRVCSVPPNQDLPEHTHDEHTVHVLVKGGLVITDETGAHTFAQGERVEFPAGTTHTARGTIDDGAMIIGVKH